MRPSGGSLALATLTALLLASCADDGSSADDAADTGRIQRDAGGANAGGGGNTGLDVSIDQNGEDATDGGGSSPLPEPDPGVPQDDWPAEWTAAELEVIELVNQERAAGANCGGRRFPPAGPVELDVQLREAARAHSKDMADQRYFSHDSQDGRDFMDRILATGYSGQGPWGENIAAGQTSAQEVVDGWMDSPGHCENIMTAEFGVLGVGLYQSQSSEYGLYWTQNFGGTH